MWKFSISVKNSCIFCLFVLFFARKMGQGFSSDRKIIMLLLSVLLHLENRVSAFWNFNFYQRCLGKRPLCPWNQPHFQKNFDKSLLSLELNKLEEIWDTVCRQKTTEDNNAKIIVSPNILCTFLLFKTSAFLSIFFQRNLPFQQVLRTSVFLSSKFLIFLYIFISLLKNIH